jgi:hypothetical protein
MSSSGLIYAVIVGAWAAYLVPMWLRREDELNRARQTQRYSAAIKVLSNRESFERRLPVAVGQTGYVPAAGDAAQRSRPKPASAPSAAKAGPGRAAARTAGPTARAGAAKKTVAAAPAARTAVTARISREQAGSAQSRSRRDAVINRRRRVVTVLFSLTTLGTLVTADLGPAMLWTMVVPALVLSAYIVWLRRDEKERATVRAGRQAAAAAQARLAAQAERQRLERLREEAAAEAEAEEVRKAQSTRRKTAAARARADRYATTTDPTLRRAANG